MNHAIVNACSSAACQSPAPSVPLSTLAQRNGLVKRLTLALRWGLRAYDVHKQRHALLQLTNAQLADIGLSRAAARQEAQRPFWDLP